MCIKEQGLERFVSKLSKDENQVAKIDREKIKLFLNEAVIQNIGLLQHRNYAVRLYMLAKMVNLANDRRNKKVIGRD